MKKRSASRALLLELLIVIGFFLISVSVLVPLLARARQRDERADLLVSVLTEAQNTAELLSSGRDPEEVLAELGFEKVEREAPNGAEEDIKESEQNATAGSDLWIRAEGETSFQVSLSRETRPGGEFVRTSLEVFQGEESLLLLPCSVYRPEKEGGS